MDTPRPLSVRIGVYGGWGEGKTSVLNFVEQIARASGHAVAWFNPWGCVGSADLWLTFLQTVAAALKSSCEPALAGLAKGLSVEDMTKKVRAYIKENQPLLTAGVAAAGTAVGLPILGTIIPAAANSVLPRLEESGTKAQKSLVEQIADLSKKRVIVLIDDLDRVTPTLLPQLLFALREVLDQPVFSFVLAVDPARVGDVLKEVNPGWKDGREYLDKIVDFPRPLPHARQECLRNLALADMKELCPFVSPQALAAILPLLPANPRLVRQFVRQTWTLKPLAERLAEDEVDWRAVLASQLIALSWPELARYLFEDEQRCAAVLGKAAQEREIAEVFEDEDKDKEKEPPESELKRLVGAEVTTSAAEKQRAIAAIDVLVGMCRAASPELVASWALLPIVSPAVTHRESRDGLKNLQGGSQMADTASSWVDRQAERAEATRSDVIHDLFSRLLEDYSDKVEAAVGEKLDEDEWPMLALAGEYVSALGTVVRDLGAFDRPSAPVGPKEFVALLEIVLKWATWTRPLYGHLRTAESQLIDEMCADGRLDPVGGLVALTNASFGPRASWSSAEGAQVLARVRAMLANRLGDQILDEFGRGEFYLWGADGDASSERQRVFHSVDVPFWTEGRRQRFLKIVDKSTTNKAIAASMLELVQFMVWVAGKGSAHPLSPEEIKLVFPDPGVIIAVWTAATNRQPNHRVIGSLKKDLPQFEKVVCVELPKPEWWGATELSRAMTAPVGAVDEPGVTPEASDAQGHRSDED